MKGSIHDDDDGGGDDDDGHHGRSCMDIAERHCSSFDFVVSWTLMIWHQILSGMVSQHL